MSSQNKITNRGLLRLLLLACVLTTLVSYYSSLNGAKQRCLMTP
jgi:hypothetical protein